MTRWPGIILAILLGVAVSHEAAARRADYTTAGAPCATEARGLGLAHVAQGGDQYDARDAYRSGQIMSLESVLRNVRRHYPGRLLDARLVRHGQPQYHIKMLRSDGKVMSVVCDAKTGQILRVK